METDYDVDGDGKRDLVKAVVQVPRSAVDIRLQLYMIHMSQEDGYPHMKEVAEKEYHPVNFADLDKKVDAPDPADWYYPDKGKITAWYMKIWITSIIIWCAALQWFKCGIWFAWLRWIQLCRFRV